MGNLAMYATKGFEYLLILGFLGLFTLFYLYFTSRRFEEAAESFSRSVDSLVDWFRVPNTVFYYQGHTWVRPEEADPGIVAVGMDDFAQKMTGNMSLRNNPTIGTKIRQGDRSWTLQDGEKSVDMLAPVSGEVVAVNIGLLGELEKNGGNLAVLDRDPYGESWILKLKAENFERERKGLLAGDLARKWMEEVVERLRLKMSPEMGAVLQDGGVPVTGMAKNIDTDNWDKLLQEFFLN